MLARQNRLHKEADIRDVLRHGSRLTTPEVYIYYQPGQTPHTRLAVVVGKKVHAHATKRHLYQRWLRSLARNYLNAHQAQKSYDMVWVAQAALLNVSEQKELEASLRPKLEQLI